jgi:hypothetical protein
VHIKGRVLGITVGCLLGMLPLLFIKEKSDKEETTEEDEKKEDDSSNVDKKETKSEK